MAKKRSSKKQISTTIRDIAPRIAKADALYSPPIRDFRVIEDLRLSHHKLRAAPLHVDFNSIPVTPRRYVRPDFSTIDYIPKRALLCARRKIRREVLLAKGKGGGSHKPPKRNSNSNLRCK